MDLKLQDFLKKLETDTLPLGIRNGENTLQQTFRNRKNKECKVALQNTLLELMPDYCIIRTTEGVAIEVPNEDKVITIILKPIIKSLDYDAYEDSVEDEE